MSEPDPALPTVPNTRAEPAQGVILPVFRTLNAIWDLGDVLAMRAAWGASEEIGASSSRRRCRQLD
jgi:hypothetical protein